MASVLSDTAWAPDPNLTTVCSVPCRAGLLQMWEVCPGSGPLVRRMLSYILGAATET